MVNWKIKSLLLLSICLFSNNLLGMDNLKIGILPVIDTLPLQVAKHNAYFKKQGLNVELIRFSSAMDRNSAMHTDQIHGFFGDIPATLLLIKNSVPLKILTVSYRTTPGQQMFGLLLSPKSKNQTGGSLTVAISKGSIIEYLLDTIKDYYPISNYQIVPKEIKQMPIRMQMLASSQIDSALLPEPLLTLAEAKGAKLMISDENLNLPLTILTIHQKQFHLKDRFLKAYSQAIEELNRNSGQYKSLMIKTCRIPKHLANQFIIYKFPLPQLPSEQEVNAVQSWMLKKNMIKQSISYHKLIQ
ncbi:MAG: ABC transporter substrate-binding protein [Deltaproteobacteria bacterium]|nr:ABC transporter substrate-binding protein [Deltaproteobacteria bacterium]MBT4526644.1 ABC transporter substrate-binding protein [Deltaproteobacteria bacterium]